MTLVEARTWALIGATFGPANRSETGYAVTCLHLPRPDMLVLWGKSFDGNDFLARVSDIGAQVLDRWRNIRRALILLRLRDGTYLTMFGAVWVRMRTTPCASLSCTGECCAPAIRWPGAGALVGAHARPTAHDDGRCRRAPASTDPDRCAFAIAYPAKRS
jgi:hypothetical protein